jgi:hypothetical protein
MNEREIGHVVRFVVAFLPSLFSLSPKKQKIQAGPPFAAFFHLVYPYVNIKCLPPSGFCEGLIQQNRCGIDAA